ncbi:hypothetical protein HON22_01045 [Candidatus Peregrinibacteria bacterium]|jgi:hypothetical protein|nr:hypothetical protein [Candidatus Peregrinibacteria bacterium]
MKFHQKNLKEFFQRFQKNLSQAEEGLLLEGKGRWNSSASSLEHIKRIQKYQWAFRCIPGLKAVFFCNTTAFRSANEHSDIDLFIVCEDHLLWTTRMILTFFLHILGVRRYGNKVAHRFCLSFFATEKGALSLADLQIQKGHDPYLAIWTATAECVIASHGFLEEYQKKNGWIGDYGLHFSQKIQAQRLFAFTKYIAVILRFLRIENLLRASLMPRTKKNASQLKDKRGTIISENYLKFHNNDIRWDIAGEF